MRQAVESKPGTGEWPRISAEDVREMIPDLDRVAEEMIDAIQRGVPEYARPLNDTYRASVRQAVTHAVHEFVERLINPAAPHDRAIQVFRNIGRNEASEGRNLEPLQNALRLGARVAWRRLGQRAARGDMDSSVLAPMGEAIFLFLDELAGACSQGYAEATAEVVGEMERRRRRLLDLIVVDPPASHDAIADLAQAARWPLPRQVAALALEPRSPDYLGPLPALPPDVLIDLTRRDPCALVPDPDGPGRAQVIERGPRRWTGPAVRSAGRGKRWRWPSAAFPRRQAASCAAPGSSPPWRSSPTRNLSARSPRPGSTRCGGCARRSRRRWARRCCAGCRVAGTPGRWPGGCTFTRRPRGTGCASSTCCSATRCTSPTPGSSWRSRCGRSGCSARRRPRPGRRRERRAHLSLNSRSRRSPTRCRSRGSATPRPSHGARHSTPTLPTCRLSWTALVAPATSDSGYTADRVGTSMPSRTSRFASQHSA